MSTRQLMAPTIIKLLGTILAVAVIVLLSKELLWSYTNRSSDARYERTRSHLHFPNTSFEESYTNCTSLPDTTKEQNMMLTLHPLILHAAPISKDMVVHSAYFDDRARDGHANTTMFLVDAKLIIYESNWIVGCGVGNHDAIGYRVRFLVEDLALHQMLGKRAFPYAQFIVECYDLPVVNGSQAFLMYRTATNSPVYVVESERPLFIPAPRMMPSGAHNITVLTCSKAHDKDVTWLPEFVRYQKTLGVDHVHINILDTFIKDGGLRAHLQDPSFAQAVLEGYLSFTVWRDWYDPGEVYLHSEILRKLDCLYRFRATYDYAFSLDTDDFFNPRALQEKNIKDFILKRCSGPTSGSCIFDWVFFYPEKCGLTERHITDGNVTKRLRSYVNRRPPDRKKSLHRLSALVCASFHEATCKWCLMPGYEAIVISPHIAYVAHNRKNHNTNKSCKGAVVL